MSSIIVEKKEDIPSSNDASYAKDHDPKDLFVRIKPEYLHPKPLIKSKPLTFENSSESSAQQNDDVGNKRKAIETVKMDSTVHVSLKKRHNER